MRLNKETQYGKHERDRPLKAGELQALRREITKESDWKARGSHLHIEDEVIECGSAERAKLIALLRNALLQVLNDNVRLRHLLAEKTKSYNRLTRAFRKLWERKRNVE